MSLLLILRTLLSATAVTGAGILTMGLGIRPVDPGLWACAQQTIGNSLPQGPFLIFLGVSKILGALALWNVGPFAKNTMLTYAAICLPPIFGAYGLAMIKDNGKAIGPVIYLAIVALYKYLDGKDGSKAKSS
jgi:hypothetical protein